MTVADYIYSLEKAIDATEGLCHITSRSEPCKGCPIGKNEGKPCPLAQLIDVKRSLEYAVDTHFNGITADSPVYSASVIAFLRRAVVHGYSVRTLRFCSDEFIAERNLIEIAQPNSASEKEG